MVFMPINHYSAQSVTHIPQQQINQATVIIATYYGEFQQRQNITMINSKNKTPCAYIKSNHNKHKTQHTTKQTSPAQTPTPAQHKQSIYDSLLKQSIYDSLLNALQLEDSQYILRLLEKQEKKSSKKQTQMHNKTLVKDMLEQTTNHPQNQNINNTDSKTNRSIKKSVVSSPRSSAKQPKLENNRHQQQQKLRTFLSSSCLSYEPKLRANKNFIQNINSYLSEIKEPHSVGKNKPKVQQQRQFRKTIEMGERRAVQSYQGQVSAKKYNNALSQLQKLLKINDLLQQRIDVQEQDMEQMKQIIRSMFCQIKHLKQQLKLQKHEKAKYSQIMHQFSSQLTKLKHASKQKRQRSHKKRNSYVPHTSMFESEPELTKTKHKQLIRNKHFDLSYLHKENDSTPLKKRGKLHKYKISDGCLDFLDEESQSTASIYKERY